MVHGGDTPPFGSRVETLPKLYTLRDNPLYKFSRPKEKSASRELPDRLNEEGYGGGSYSRKFLSWRRGVRVGGVV